MRISDWSSEVCSSDLPATARKAWAKSAIRSSASSQPMEMRTILSPIASAFFRSAGTDRCVIAAGWLASVSVPPRLTASFAIFSASRKAKRSEEHTSELQSLMRISYAVFCLKKKTKKRYKNNIKIYESEDITRKEQTHTS